MPNTYLHQAVLLPEVIEALNIQQSGIYIDATFGRGGHSREILKHLGTSGRLIGIDKDHDAVEAAYKIEDKRFSIIQASFAAIKKIADLHNITGKVDGILLDLGVSSPQLEDAQRGFSFRKEGPLDMRMDKMQDEPLANILLKMKENTLFNIIKEYGEEKFAKRIARAIVEAQRNNPITTTIQLADIISKAHPAWERDKHPATKTFQALRIFINHELDDLKQALPNCLDTLAINGRLCVISFHSLEDRLTKKFIQQEIQGCKSLQKLPLKHSELNVKLRRIGRAIRPSLAEINHNPRARSAVLRIVEKIK